MTRQTLLLAMGLVTLTACPGLSGPGDDGGSDLMCGGLESLMGTTFSGAVTGTVEDGGVFFQLDQGAPFPYEFIVGTYGIDCPDQEVFTAPPGIKSDNIGVTLALLNPPTVGTLQSTSASVCGGEALGLDFGGQNGAQWHMEGAGSCLLGGTGTPAGSWTLNLTSVAPYDAGSGGVYYHVHGSLTGSMVPVSFTLADGGVTLDMTF